MREHWVVGRAVGRLRCIVVVCALPERGGSGVL